MAASETHRAVNAVFRVESAGRAQTANETDWARIAARYAALAERAPSPVVELSRGLFEKTCDVELIEEAEVIAEKENARFKARGLSSLVEQAWMLTVR